MEQAAFNFSVAARRVRQTSVNHWHNGQREKASGEAAAVLTHLKKYPSRSWTGQELRKSLIQAGGPDLPIGSISRIFGELFDLDAISQSDDDKRKCQITGVTVMARRLNKGGGK